MGIAQLYPIEVAQITRGVDSRGTSVTTETNRIKCGAYYGDNRNTIGIEGEERVYMDTIELTMRYTPLVHNMVMTPSSWVIYFRGEQYRVNDSIESKDRMSVQFTCYRNMPEPSV